jgi:hypothetical protein
LTQTDKFALLRDLANLVRKYGPTVFSDLAVFLRNPEMVAELVAILETAETAGTTARTAESHTAPTREIGAKGRSQRLLSEIDKDQPEKARALSSLYEALTAKRALPTLRELRNFAVDNGLEAVTAKARDEAINSLLRGLATRPMEEIRSMLGRIRMAGTPGNRSLEGWTEIILGKERSRGRP